MTTITVLLVVGRADPRADQRDQGMGAVGAVRAEARRHHAVIREERAGWTTVSCRSAHDAIRIAALVERETDEPVRAGVALGEDDDGVAQRALLIASALAGAAMPGEILIDEIAALLVRDREEVTCEEREPVTAPGIEDPVRVYAAGWREAAHREPVRVVVADDAALVRSGIVRLLRDEGFEVIGEASDADELVALVDQSPPDLVITDIRMPPTNSNDGIRAAKVIRDRHPEVAALVLSQHVEARAAGDLLDDRTAGVGYLLKERVTALEDFADACRRVAAGGRVIDPLVSEQLVRLQREGDPLERLSEREREVLGLMAQGRSNAAIASELHVSPKTLESHISTIFTKLDLIETRDEHRRVAAVVRWLQTRQ